MTDHDHITTYRQFLEWFPHCDADRHTMFLATDVTAFNDEDEEMLYLDEANRLQVEGFILSPRRWGAVPVELELDDSREADFVLSVIERSQVPLAARQAEGVLHAARRDRFPLGAGVAA